MHSPSALVGWMHAALRPMHCPLAHVGLDAYRVAPNTQPAQALGGMLREG